MKRIKKSTWLLCLLLCGLLMQNVGAAEESFGWYCVHVKEHIQPQADARLRFVEELGGFYIDHRHTEQTSGDRVVYLTFDAGYENGNVGKVLDALRDAGAVGNFFIVGCMIEKYLDTVQRMVAEGHTVGNHTMHHKDMSRLAESEFLQELQAVETAYEELIGASMPKLYRPPEGRFSKENLQNARKNGYSTVFWSFAYPDWDNNRQMSPAKAEEIILENLHNGEVMLLHPTSSVNAEILPAVLQRIKEAGYRFGSLSELVSGDAAE